jgi:preprotein translocase subunit SecE
VKWSDAKEVLVGGVSVLGMVAGFAVFVAVFLGLVIRLTIWVAGL